MHDRKMANPFARYRGPDFSLLTHCCAIMQISVIYNMSYINGYNIICPKFANYDNSICRAIMQISVIDLYDWYFQFLMILLIFDEF